MPRHDTLTMTLHWLVALLILASYVTSGLVEDGPSNAWATTLHGSIGLSVFSLSLLRILWHGLAIPPEAVVMPALMVRLSRWSHMALYAMMLTVPVLGLLTLWSDGQALSLFGLWMLRSPFSSHHGFSEFLGDAHGVAANGMIALALLHASAAVFHQIVLGDHLLERMLPRRRTRVQE